MPDAGPAPNFVWCVSGRGMVVRSLFAAQRAGLLKSRISAILTDRPCEIESFAAAEGIPCERLQSINPDDRAAFDNEIVACLKAARANWVGLTFNRLIGRNVIDHVEGRVINLHMSLLPAFSGFYAIKNALAAGVRVAGVTVHLADCGVDAGPILGQLPCAVQPTDDVETLGRRLFQCAVPLVLQMVRSIETAAVVLDDARRPNWSHDVKASPHGFPSIDSDLGDFASAFCESLLTKKYE